MGVSGTLVFPLRLATGSQRASSGARPGSGAFSLRCKTVSSSTRNLIWTKGNTTRAARTTTRAVAPNGPSDPDDGDSDKDAMLSLRKGVAAVALSSFLLASSPSELMATCAPSANQEDTLPAASAPAPLLKKGDTPLRDWMSSTFAAAAAAAAPATPAAPSKVSLAIPNGTPTSLDKEEVSNVRLFKDSTPSVVFITNKVMQPRGYNLDPSAVLLGAGSGFVYDDKGHIVTNFHVVNGANELNVTFKGDPKVYVAKLLGYDDDKDVAVLKVDKPDLRPIPLGCSSSLEVGQKVFAIGNPFGLDHTLTTGIVSGLGRELDSGITGRPIVGVIQTDAALNPGNSGGPLLDSAGRLVGINTAILSSTGASMGVSFALPIDNVKGIVEQIIQFGRVTRPVLGLVLGPDGSLPQLLGPDAPEGVLVLGVSRGGPAEDAGLLGTFRDARGDVVLGDVVTEMNGRAVKNSADLYKILDELKVGDEVNLTVQRGSRGKVNVKVTLGEKVTRFDA